VTSQPEGATRRLPSGLTRRLLGTEVPARLRPLLGMTLLAVVGQWMLTAYLPIYLVTRLGVDAQTAGPLLAAAAATGLVVGPVGGRVADHVGRVPVLAASLVLQAASAGLLLAAPSRASALAAAATLAVGFTLRTTVQNTLAADLSGPDDRDSVFALLRTAVNVSAALGPAAGAGLLLLGWPVLWAAALGTSLIALAVTGRVLTTPTPSAESVTERTSSPAAAAATANAAPSLTSPTAAEVPPALPERALPARHANASAPLVRGVGVRVWIGVAANTLAWAVYNTFEVLLPIVIVATYHLPPSLWGLLFLINPLGVVLLQVRLVTATAGLARGTRLVLATALMSSSFLLLLISHHPVALALVVVIFTTGEILWGPTSQALLVSVAPHQRRGLVMGLLASSATAGAVLATAGGLPLIAHAGAPTTWAVIAALGLVSGQLFRLTATGNTRTNSAPSPPTASIGQDTSAGVVTRLPSR